MANISYLEDKLMREISLDNMWALITRFSTLVRESGSQDERTAMEYIIGKLKEYGIPYNVYEPDLYLSIPKSATVEVLEPEKKVLRHDNKVMNPKVPSMSPSADITAELVYVPSVMPKSAVDMFDAGVGKIESDISGKIVLTEGLSIMPKKAAALMKAGCIGIITINPGPRTHEGIMTTIWGTPTLENIKDKPSVPGVNICKEDGEYLKNLLNRSRVKVRIKTVLEEGWKKCLIPVADVKSPENPTEFLLLHGHLDSWHVGIGDNATGNAVLLELARVLHNNRNALKRSVKVAWWPGHSTGRYAGSTWFADHFALELDEHCIAQVNCDSPGCVGATSYEDLMCMSEVEDFMRKVVKDVTGLEAYCTRPVRAGDYSFNHIGITSFLMLSSTIPEAVRKEKGLYAVGGCGGNVWWHTEEDDMRVADKENLLRDAKLYLISVLRVINADIYPFDFRAFVNSSLEIFKKYQEASENLFDFKPLIDDALNLKASLENLYKKTQSVKGKREQEIINQTLMKIARILIPVNYTDKERFDHDPAVPIPAYPDIYPATQLPSYKNQTNEFRFLINQLTRGANKVRWAFREAKRVVDSTIQSIG
ncbi:MAG: M28 family peptidase [Nitrososphaerales archaeon]